MVNEKLVSADSLTWPHAYCGEVKLHPNDDTIQFYLDSDQVFTSEPNGEGIELILVAYKSKSMTAHFRRKDAISSEYLDMVRKNIHSRVIDVVSHYIIKHGDAALNVICKCDVSDFNYSKCLVEQNLNVGGISYRPDIVVYQKDITLPRIELEVVFTHDIERDRREVLSKEGHLLLSINIERWVNDLAQQEIENVSDDEILRFVKAKKFSYYVKKELEQAKRIWNEIQVVEKAEFFIEKKKRFGLTSYDALLMHNLNLNNVISRDYSDSITKKAVAVLEKITPKLNSIKEQIREREDFIAEQEKERQERINKFMEHRRERELKEERERQERIRKREEEIERERKERKENLEREREERKERLSIEIERHKEASYKRKIKLEMLKKKFFIGQ